MVELLKKTEINEKSRVRISNKNLISVSIVSVNWHNIICFKKLVLLLLLSNIIIIVFENIGNLLRMILKLLRMEKPP